MAFDTFNPRSKPRIGTSLRKEQIVDRASFGDGYEQVSPRGINHTREIWMLSWAPGIPDADADEIEAFWDAHGVWLPFWYTVTGRSTQKLYRFNSSLERPQVLGHLDAISVEIKQAFDIETT